MKKIVTVIFIFIGIVFVAGCSDRGEPESAIVSTSTITIKSTLLPTRTITPQPTATATTDPCFQQVNFETMSEELSGILVLKDNSYEKEDYYLDWESGERIPFQTQRAHPNNYLLSPDGQWLAYYADKDILVVEELFGKFQYTLNMDVIAVEPNWLVGWLNNETIIALFFGEDYKEMDYLVSINPFSGRVQRLSTDYPNPVQDWMIWRMGSRWNSITVYDPSLKYVAYLSDYDWNTHLTLFDIENNVAISSIDNFARTSIIPIWKNDSSGFYTYNANMDGWFFMDVDGKSTRLTNFSSKYPHNLIHYEALSNNEKYLVYYIIGFDNENKLVAEQLQILNLETLDVVNTCHSIPKPNSRIIWSPDDRFVTFSEELTDRSIQTWIMDIEERTVSLVDENAYPVLWVEDNN